MEYKKTLKYRTYRWIWINAKRLSNWAGMKCLEIAKEWDDKQMKGK